MSSWILGVQKLTESRGVLLRFAGAFVKPEPEGTGGGVEGPGTRPLLGKKPTSFPAVSASQVCERQCMCDPCPINDTLYCNHVLWGSKVNTSVNKLLGPRYNPLGWSAAFTDCGWGGEKQHVQHNTTLIIVSIAVA